MESRWVQRVHALQTVWRIEYHPATNACGSWLPVEMPSKQAVSPPRPVEPARSSHTLFQKHHYRHRTMPVLNASQYYLQSALRRLRVGYFAQPVECPFPVDRSQDKQMTSACDHRT